MTIFIIIVGLILIPALLFKMGKYTLPLVPVAILLVLLANYFDDITGAITIIVSNYWLWILIGGIGAYIVGKNLSPVMRITLCLLAIAAGIVIPVMIDSRTVQPISNIDDISLATIYSIRNEAFELQQQDLIELQTMLKEYPGKKDTWNKLSTLELADNNYSISLTMNDGSLINVSFYQPIDQNEIVVVASDGNITYYQAADESKPGSKWIEDKIAAIIKDTILKDHYDAIKALKDSVTMENSVLTFTVPNDYPSDGEILIASQSVFVNFTSYWLSDYNDNHSWEPGKTYTVDFSTAGYVRFLVFSARIDGYIFDLVDLFEQLPENQQAPESIDYFNDAGI